MKEPVRNDIWNMISTKQLFSPFAFLLLTLLACNPVLPPPKPISEEAITQPSPETQDKYTKLREQMVRTQLTHPRDGRLKITDSRVIKAMLKVPRHKFVPANLINYAYIDAPLSIGEGQTISQPYMVAIMTECLGLKGDEKILEIGTGSGYQAAILAEIVKEVYTIEIIESLTRQAEKTLEALGYLPALPDGKAGDQAGKNIKVRCGDGYAGWPEYAPFDGVIITAATTHIPQPLLDQLKDGGVIVLPLGKSFSASKLTVVKKNGDKTTTREVLDCRFVPMTGKMMDKDNK